MDVTGDGGTKWGMANKIAVKYCSDEQIWSSAVKLFEELGISQTTGVDRLLALASSDVLNQVRKETGVSNLEVISRLTEWFTSLPKKAQLGILSGAPEIRSEMFTQVLQEQSGKFMRAAKPQPQKADKK